MFRKHPGCQYTQFNNVDKSPKGAMKVARNMKKLSEDLEVKTSLRSNPDLWADLSRYATDMGIKVHRAGDVPRPYSEDLIHPPGTDADKYFYGRLKLLMTILQVTSNEHYRAKLLAKIDAE